MSRRSIASNFLTHPISCIGSSILGSIFYFLKLTIQRNPSEKLLRIIVYISLCLSIPISMLLARKWGSMKHPLLRIGVYLFVFIATSLYSFLEDKINEHNRYGNYKSLFDLFSYGAFSLASLSISKQIDFGFEVGMFSFFLQSLTTTALNMNNILFAIFTFLFCCLLISIRFYLECSQQIHTTSNSYPLHEIQVHSNNPSPHQETTYDVFVSFVYDETTCEFIDYLLSALLRKGIQTSLGSIEASKICLVIFSQDYAYWEQRLDELEKIMECRSTRGQIVVPIFHNVDPSHVKFQSGTLFSDAFALHEKEFEEEKVGKWREAMSKATQVFGWYTNSTSTSYVHPSQFVDEIVQDLLQKLNPNPPQTSSYYNYVYVSYFGRGAHCAGFLSCFLHRREMIVRTQCGLKGYTESECHTRAIETSEILFIVFSEDYAESEWHLDEVVEVMECHERYGKIVVPIFYEISPSEVRKQSGSYGVGFGKYEGEGEKVEKVRKWRNALRKAANMVGWNTSFHGISELAEEIAQDAQSKIQSNS